MTLYAVLPEFVIMNILMATCTAFIGHTSKLLHFDPVYLYHLMTFNAVYFCMFSDYGEAGIAMFKVRCRLEGPVTMTGGTIQRKCSMMEISVTREAFLVES